MTKKSMLGTLFFLLFFSVTANVPPIDHEGFFQPYADQTIDENHSLRKIGDFITSFFSSVHDMFVTIAQNISHISSALFDQIKPVHEYSNVLASVRYAPDDSLCEQEIEYRTKRRAVVQNNMEGFVGIPLTDAYCPTIAFCFSGGGFRAMVSTLGFLCAAQEIGLLNVTTYMAGLSGSTWALAPWIASGKTPADYLATLHEKISNGVQTLDTASDLHAFVTTLGNKIFYQEYISTIDIYGALLANTLLTDLQDKRLYATLSQTHAIVQNAEIPFPIYTSIQANIKPYEWMEITPFEIGSSFLKSFVPVWAYGRQFEQGFSKNDANEQTLGYYMGVCGSAFEVNLHDIVLITATKIANIEHEIPEVLETPLIDIAKLIIHSPVGQARLFPSMINNYTYGMNSSVIKKDEYISLVDAGIDFNLPFPPLLRRARTVDIIIVYDASDDYVPGDSLREAQNYAQRFGLKFPPIDYTNIHTNVVSIFTDSSDPSVPTIIYFPLIKNPTYSQFDPDACIANSYCDTFNFKYSEEQISELAGLSYFTVHQQASLIKSTITRVIQNRQAVDA